jgi:hypothetical protein
VSRYGWETEGFCEEFFVVNVGRKTRDFVDDGIFQGLMLLTHCAKPVVVDRSFIFLTKPTCCQNDFELDVGSVFDEGFGNPLENCFSEIHVWNLVYLARFCQ